jgi:transglutaminase-like putative cysteine protease
MFVSACRAAQTTARHAWRVGLLGCLAAATPAIAGQTPTPTIAPPAAWVMPLTPEPGRTLPAEQVAKGVQYLLLDQQQRVDAHDKTHYRHLASKALNAQGVESIANIEIRFDPSFQKLTLHTINIRRGNAVIAKLPSAQVRVLQRESGLESLIFDGSRTAHVFLEDVRVGDVVEYAYSLRGSNPVFGNRHGGRFDFQFDVPVERLHARLLWPAGRQLQWQLHNQAAPAREEEAGGQRIYSWDLRAVDARVIEDDAPAWFDPYPFAEWGEFANWHAVAEWALPLYQLPAQPGPRVRAAAEQLAAGHTTPAERLAAALRYVQSEVRYLGIEVGPGSHAPNPPELVLERRYGDCKDKTQLTVALLRALGIEAQPALVHTSMRRAIESNRPSPNAFNHVLVRARLDGRDYWLDPTRPPQQGGLDQLVQADYGRALVVDARTDALVPMAGDKALARQRVVRSVIDSRAGFDKPVRYTVTTEATGAAAESLRSTLNSRRREDLQKDYLNFYVGQFGAMEVSAPMRIEDDVKANRLSVTEEYALKAFWQRSDKHKRLEGGVPSLEISEHLRRPQSLVRNSPLSIAYPTDLLQITEVKLPESWTLRANKTHIDDPAFDFEHHEAWDEATRTLTLTDHFQSHVDHISAEQVARYAANLDKARDSTYFTLYKYDPGGHAANDSSPTHWLPAVLTTLCLIGFGWLARRAHAWDPPPARPPVGPAAPWPLGGWLILPLLGIPLSLYSFGSAVLDIWPSMSTQHWVAITTAGTDEFQPLTAMLLAFELVANLGMLAAYLLLAVLFLTRRTSLPRLYIATLAGQAAVLLIDNVWALLIPTTADGVTSKEWGQFVRSVVSATIWIAYFRVSERVKATFVVRRRFTAPAALPNSPAPLDA